MCENIIKLDEIQKEDNKNPLNDTKKISNRDKVKIRWRIAQAIDDNDVLNNFTVCGLSGFLWGTNYNGEKAHKINDWIYQIVEELTTN